MKSFLAGMNFPRWIILVMTLASLGLGFSVYQKSARLKEVERELRQAPKLVQEIQSLALQLNNLQKAADSEGLRGEADLALYIRRTGSHDRVRIGQIETSPTTRTPLRGVEDLVYRIDPQNKDMRFQRTQIGNFLYKLEEQSRRVKVTRLKLDPVTRIRPGEIGDDLWTFEAEITSRRAAAGG